MDAEGAEKYVKKQYKLVPPDGGWAYMIFIAFVINFIASNMFLPSMGMIFHDFYKKLGMSSSDIQLLNGLSTLFVAIAAFASGPMMKVMSMRKLSFLGSIVMCAGVFGIVFVDSFAMLMLTHGVLWGAGMGVIYNVACTSLNNYFLKKRFIVTSIAQTIAAAAAMVAPLLVHWTSDNYGYRGTIVLMTSVFMQTLVASSLQQPVEWHLKRVPISTETEELLDSKSCNNLRNMEPFKVIRVNIDQITLTRRKSFLENVKSAVDWPFLSQFLRRCACVGAPLSLSSDVMFTLFVPQALFARRWTEGEVAWALALLSFGDIAMRILLIVASSWLKNVGSHVLYITGMALDIATKLVFLWFPHPTVTFVTLTLTGCSRCLIVVLFALVIAEAVPPEKYAMAYGIGLFIFGTIGMTLGTALGAVRDATDDYTVMFYLLIAVMAAVTIAWCIEVYRDNRQTDKFPKSLVLQTSAS